MKYLDRGVIYISITTDTTKEEIDTMKEQYKDKTIVCLRSGKTDMNIVLKNLLKASLKK